MPNNSAYNDLTNPQYANDPYYQAARAQLHIGQQQNADALAQAQQHQGIWDSVGTAIAGAGHAIGDAAYQALNTAGNATDSFLKGLVEPSGGWSDHKTGAQVVRNVENIGLGLAKAPQQFFTSVQQMGQDKGVAYGVTYGATNLAIAYLLGEAGTAAGVSGKAGEVLTASQKYDRVLAASRAADRQTIEDSLAKGASSPLSPSDAEALDSALTRIKHSDPRYHDQVMSKVFDGSPDAFEQNLAEQANQRLAADAYDQTPFSQWREKMDGLGKAAAAARAFGEKVLGPTIGIPIKAIGKANAFINDPRFQLAAQLQMQGLSPKDRQLAEMGVIDQNGKLVALRNAIADDLGVHSGFFHSFIANIFNIDMNIVDDPISKFVGAVFKPIKAARAFFGKYAEVADKMGWRTSGDIAADYAKYGSVKRAIDYMAKHTPAEIAQAFDGMFGAGVLRSLGRATTADEVIQILDNEVAGRELVRSTVPRMSWYDVFKTSLKGELGTKFGFLGRILDREVEVNDQLAADVEAQTGYDIRPNSSHYLNMNEAGRARVLLRKRLAQQFSKMPMWLDKSTLKMTNTVIDVNDVNAIPSLMRMVEKLGMSRETAVSFGNALIESVGDPVAFKRAYRQLTYETIMRHVYAVGTAAEHEPLFLDMEKKVSELVDKITGADAGGTSGAFTVGDENWDLVETPYGSRLSAVGSTHLGTVVLPSYKDMQRLQRFMGELFLNTSGASAAKALLETDSKLIDIINLANFSTDTAEDLLSHMEAVRSDRLSRPFDYTQYPEIHEGWDTKSAELIASMRKMVDDLVEPTATRAERVAKFVKELENQKGLIDRQIEGINSGLTQRLDTPVLNFDDELNRIVNEAGMLGISEGELKAFLRLRGEQQAVHEMLAETKARFDNQFSSYSNVTQLAEQVSKMTTERDEAAKKFRKQFLDKWTQTTERRFGDKVLRRVPSIGKLTTKYEYRNTADVIADTAQAYLDDWFKPLALASPAWAARVSMSEVGLNAFRIGGSNFLESVLSQSIAKHVLKLGLEENEKKFVRNAVGSLMLGFEEGLLKTLSGEQRQRLIEDTFNLYMDHNGHLPYGIHGSGDSPTKDNIDNYATSQVWGVNENSGIPEATNRYKSAKYTRKQSTDYDIGTSMVEAMKRTGDDVILRHAAEFLDNEARFVGQRILAENPSLFGDAVKRAVDKLSEDTLGLFQRRNDVLNQLLDEMATRTDFKMMNDAERQALTEEIQKRKVSPEQVTADMVPKSYRNAYDLTTRRITRLESETLQIEKRIAESNKKINDLLESLGNTVPEINRRLTAAGSTFEQAEERLRDLAQQIKELDQKISEHPYHESYTVLEKGAALRNNYGETLDNLRETLRGNVKDWVENGSARLRDLLGDGPVVLPRSGYAEMSGERMFTFTDEAGNPLPNGESYAQIVAQHPELWSDNEAFKNYLPFGMPGVHGADAISRAIASGMPVQQWFDEVKRTINYVNTLDRALAHMERGEWSKSWDPLMQVDLGHMQTIRSLREAPELLPDTYTPDTAYNVKGVPGKLILGVGKTNDKTLADLALHLRQNNTLETSRIFDKRFFPNYKNTEADRVRFATDFAKYQRILKLKNPTSQEQKEAIRWFGKYVSYSPDEWETTAKKVWDKNVDLYRGEAAKKLGRDDYMGLLEQRRAMTAARSRAGLDKKNAIDTLSGDIDSLGEKIATPLKTTLNREMTRLQKFQTRRSEIDLNLMFEHDRRTGIAEHVAAQNAKSLDRQLDSITDDYITRIRKANKGTGRLVRIIEARTATLNGQIQRQTQKELDSILADQSRNELAGNLDDLRDRAEQYVYAQLQQYDPQFLARFDRSRYCLTDPSKTTGDPMMDWAKTIVQHSMGIATGSRGTVYPEIWREIVSKDISSARSYAEWFQQGYDNSIDRPTGIPAPVYVSPLAKGAVTHLVQRGAGSLQRNVLAPIVNELSREPTFAWEYHQQMEVLRPYVFEGVIDEETARRMAGEEATIRMAKYVHEPMDKTWFEYNMRVLAPFYFAKNQAWRRAVRFAGENPSGLYKYMRNQYALTQTVAGALDPANQQKGYTFAGSAAVLGLGSGLMEAAYILQHQQALPGLKKMAFDLSPTSANSVLLMGSLPGATGFVHSLLQIPFGPLVTVPAKWVDNRLESAGQTGMVSAIQAAIGKESFNTSWLEDLFYPNSLAKGIKNIVNSSIFHNRTAVMSEQNRIQNVLMTTQFDKFYSEVEKQYKTVNAKQLAMYGSRQGLITLLAYQKFNQWATNPVNMQNMINQSNLMAAGTMAVKLAVQWGLPTSVVISSPMTADREMKRIAAMKNPNGSLKYPTVLDQLNAYTEMHPDRPFDFVSGSQYAPGTLVGEKGRTFGDSREVFDWLSKHASVAKQYPQASTFLAPYNPGAPYYNPAYQLETALGLRQSDTPEQYYKAMMLVIGNQMESQIYLQARLDPKNIETGSAATPLDREYRQLLEQATTYQERYNLAIDPKYKNVSLNYNARNNLSNPNSVANKLKSFGLTQNIPWSQVYQSGQGGATAIAMYTQMNDMLKDTNARKSMTDDQYQFYSGVNATREAWLKKYAESKPEEQKRLVTLWYTWTDELSSNPQFAPYQAYVNTVLRKLPKQQGLGNG